MRLILIGILVTLSLCVPAAAAAADGSPVRLAVDARGCIMPPLDSGELVKGRTAPLAAASIMPTEYARNRCQPEQTDWWRGAERWRVGSAMVGRRPATAPLHSVTIMARRVPMDQAEDWLITRVEQREIRVQSSVDQCSPRGIFRVVETNDEIRIRFARPYSRGGACTLVGYVGWDNERVIKLKAPVGTRTIVPELEAVSAASLDEHCPWFQRSLGALIHGAPADELASLARESHGATSEEYRWYRTIVGALKHDDPSLRARMGRGIRRDMRRLAYPEDCTRPLVFPTVESSEPTRYVYGGKYDDADLAGVDADGRVTWTNRLADGAAMAIDVCPDGATALIVESSPDTSWPTEARVRTRTLDLATGAVSPPRSLRRFTLGTYGDTDVGASVQCSGPGTGWVKLGWYDYTSPSSQVYIDEIWPGGSRRVSLPEGIGADVLGDGFVLWQTNEGTKDYYERGAPGRIRRYDLRTGEQSSGPLLSSQAQMFLSPDGKLLATDHGPIRIWDVSGQIRLLQSFADPLRGIGRDSGAWSDDGTFRYMTTDLELRPHQLGKVYRISPTDGTMTATDVVSRGQMDLIEADLGRVFSFDEYGSAENDGGLQTWEGSTSTWKAFAPALDRGHTAFFAAVRPD